MFAHFKYFYKSSILFILSFNNKNNLSDLFPSSNTMKFYKLIKMIFQLNKLSLYYMIKILYQNTLKRMLPACMLYKKKMKKKYLKRNILKLKFHLQNIKAFLILAASISLKKKKNPLNRTNYFQSKASKRDEKSIFRVCC